MKLPNRQSAYIPKEKLLGYLLSEVHPVGKFKAKFFRKLGFNEAGERYKRITLWYQLHNYRNNYITKTQNG